MASQTDVLVLTGSHNVEISLNSNIANMKDLRDQISENISMDLTSYRILRFEKKYNEYVDVTNPGDIAPGSVIKLVLDAALPATEAAAEIGVIPDGSRSLGKWPVPFPIPDFTDPNVDVALASMMASLMTDSALKETYLRPRSTLKMLILDSLAQKIWCFTEYPTGEHLTQVVQQLVKKYPCLCDESRDGWTLWKKSLSDKMSNMRKSMTRHGWQSVMINTGKRSLAHPNNPPAQRKVEKSMHGAINFRPNYPVGEDIHSSKRHKAELIALMGKRNIDVAKVRQLMALSFAHRRYEILDQIEDDAVPGKRRFKLVQEILSDWPALSQPSVVKDEFQRITGTSLDKEWYKNLDEVASTIISIYATKSKKNFGDLSKKDTIELRDLAVKAIPALLFEAPSFLRYFDEGVDLADIMPKDDDGDVNAFVALIGLPGDRHLKVIVAERSLLLEYIETLNEAVMYMLAYHYVLNLEYSSPLSFEFMQRAILRIGLFDKKPNRKVATLLRIVGVDM